jgi:predicted MPP superfamily phosphohydrolase
MFIFLGAFFVFATGDILGVSLKYSFIIVFFLVTSMVIFGYFSKDKLVVTEYNIKTKKDINLKIVFVSDLHIGKINLVCEKRLEKMVGIINKIGPDMVLFGGDIVESEPKEYGEIFKQIRSKYGLYGVLGNHEYYPKNDPNTIAKKLEDNYGMRVLMDEFVDVGGLRLVGRVDSSCFYQKIKRKSIKEITDDTDKFTLLLDHNPNDFGDTIKNNIDLQLSGHTHNGQYFPFNILAKLFFVKSYGVLRKKKSTLITSSGLGYSGIPIRVASKSEIVVINLNNS